MTIKKTLILFLVFTMLFTLVIYFMSNVDTSITESDISTIKKLQLKPECENTESFESELSCVKSVQNSIYNHIQVSRNGIKEGKSREPIDLMIIKKGLCYDRSRFIEKVLNYYGFEIRHVSIFYTNDYSLKTLISHNVKSHAFLEVLTSKGWMLVDSIDPFIGIDNNGRIYDTISLRNQKSREDFVDIFKNKLPSNFLENYMVVYGLYSRHGKFYPPYTPIPDINWFQLLTYN